MPLKKIRKKIRNYLKVLGPGLVTGASDDDPSGIATYSQAGAQFGFATLWTALLTFPLMASIQEMCARIGIVTQEGLTGNLKKHYHKSFLYLMMAFSFPAIVLNIGADIQGMGAVANMLAPGIPVIVFSTAFTAILLFCIIKFPYHKLATWLKWLCLSLCLYIIVPFFTNTDWKAVFRNTFIPHIELNKDFLMILVGILGTTISPYLFFWQATMQVEDMGQHSKRIIVDKRIIDNMKKDVNFGMFFSNLVMFFLMLTAGSVIYGSGKIETIGQAAEALRPALGNISYLLFAIGIIGTGFIAIPVLAGTLSYILAETFNWKQGLDKQFHEAKGFYLAIALSLLLGLGMDLLHISPVKALLYTAVLYGLTAPFMIGIILHIANDKKVMGKFTNGTVANILGGSALVIMSAAAIALLCFQFIT